MMAASLLGIGMPGHCERAKALHGPSQSMQADRVFVVVQDAVPALAPKALAGLFVGNDGEDIGHRHAGAEWRARRRLGLACDRGGFRLRQP